MTWTDKAKEWGGGDVSFLSENGECITFVIVGDPVLIEGKFKNQATTRIGCPIISMEGFSILVVGKRVFRRLAKHEANFKKHAFDLVRCGESGDQKTSYKLTRCDLPELESKLLKEAKKPIDVSTMAEAIDAAKEIAVG